MGADQPGNRERPVKMIVSVCDSINALAKGRVGKGTSSTRAARAARETRALAPVGRSSRLHFAMTVFVCVMVLTRANAQTAYPPAPKKTPPRGCVWMLEEPWQVSLPAEFKRASSPTLATLKNLSFKQYFRVSNPAISSGNAAGLLPLTPTMAEVLGDYSPWYLYCGLHGLDDPK